MVLITVILAISIVVCLSMDLYMYLDECKYIREYVEPRRNPRVFNYIYPDLGYGNDKYEQQRRMLDEKQQRLLK